MRRRAFKVTLVLPEDVSMADMAAYIQDAVASMKGSSFPGDDEQDGDPLFFLEGDSIKVSYHQQKDLPRKWGKK